MTHVNVTINNREYRMACEDGQEAHLLLESGERNAILAFGKHSAEKGFQLIDGGIESLGRLLQGITLTHRAAPPRLGAAA